MSYEPSVEMKELLRLINDLLTGLNDPEESDRIQELDEGSAIVDDYAGGNIDDAYIIGREDGEIVGKWDLREEIINILKDYEA